ncbi:MAG: substrate-binding domain-containing protein [Anaerococcus sp.]|jgi:phosphate transport system substrate-binding protein|nr:substrate-binding domain-containing protein [Peptoniphilaceae bacterium]MDY3054665.1 substrate-binding domain-containing protein [Anaerococcus sp.]
MKIKNTKFIIAALSLTFVLSACGGNGNSEDNNKEEGSQVESTETADTTDDTEKSEEDTTADAEDFEISVVSREDGSGTRGAFIELTGLEEEKDGEKVDNTTDEAIVQNSTNAVMQTVSQDPNAIGYISLGSLNDTVKAIKIDGVEATDENIKAGDYNLQRNFNLAYKEDELDDLGKDFLAYVLSEDAQKIVTDEGYIAVESQDYESKKPEGSITVAGSTSVTPVMEKLIEAYKEVNPNATIELQSTGSSAGIESTISGVSQIAMASRDLKDDEAKELQVEVLAQDGIAVIVNKDDSKIDDLTMDQVKQIFSGEIKSTSDL